METKANNVLVGAFTLGVAAFLVIFALWAAKYSSDRSWNEYDVVFTEAVTGLTVGATVQYNGISVGSVSNLRLDPRDARRVVARIRVQAEAPVKEDTRARLALTGVTGTAIIQLSGGAPESPRLVATDDDPVPVIPTAPSALQNITETAGVIAERLDKLLSDENIAHIAKALDDVQKVTGSIADQREDIAELITNARQVTAALENTVNRVDATVENDVPRLVASLERSLDQLDAFTRNANALVEENRDPIARFSHEGLSQVGPTLSQLRATLRDIDRVTTRLRDNPSGYLLGRDRAKEFEP
ncbi:MlaD family protein [Coralloluteibacterium stylophorae]|uniref:MCE family protein n=1 Tax=Coralloluteibacterium stylophorae TaxID=1776034 RepID=A0A8J7VU11_9GAMM|nr:MlaD family protein [Coralloluteibacterium stylophorae]MBS7457806.1 MCE family protein [Coralloluteibacterium stylophorae]